MTWATFSAINKRIVTFDDWKSKVTLINVIGWGGAIVAFVTSFSGGFDWVAPRTIAALMGRPELIAAWHSGGHWTTKLLASLAVFGSAYLLVFAVQAGVLLSEPTAAPATADYRSQLASAIGANFKLVHDYYDVQNGNGDCHIIQTADFEVNDLPLSHLERKLGSSSATSRGEPKLEASVYPPRKSDPETKCDCDANPRVYHFRFRPALRGPGVNCQTKITEEVRCGVWMFLEDVKFDPVLGGHLESIGHAVQEPTDRLELEVAFPYGYRVTGDRFFKVRLGATETVHEKEEERLWREKALDAGVRNDRQIIKLVVEKPILGLCYYLCWVPPQKPAAGSSRKTSPGK